MVVFGSVVERGDVIVGRDPDLFVKKAKIGLGVVENVEVLNFVWFLTEVVLDDRFVLLKVIGRDEEELSVGIFGGG